MIQHLGKTIICMNLFVSSITAMQQPIDPQWRCPEHTQSKSQLATRALVDSGLSVGVAYVGLKDTQFMRSIFGSNDHNTPVEVTTAGGTPDQRLAIMESQDPNAQCLKHLAFSGLLLCDAGSNLWKIRNYRDYLEQKHEMHHCLTDHKSN